MTLKGHSRSFEVTNTFLAITLDWMKVEACNWCHCVPLVITRLVICNMTYFSHVDLDLDLDPRSNFEFDLNRSKVVYFEPL